MNIALILSGGTGSRMGLDIPKQYIEVAGKPIITYCMEKFQNSPAVDCIQIIADIKWQELILKYAGDKVKGFSVPGENRQLSILNGMEDILQYADEWDNILIHDAARPLVSEQTIEKCFRELEKHEVYFLFCL